jgi:nucleoside-diphosphate-sugar epimerase
MKAKGERVLVTGGAGFIGSHLVNRLLSEGYEVTVLDDLSSGSMENISPHIGVEGLRFFKGDIRDVELVQCLVEDVEVVFHLAAVVSVPLSISDPLSSSDVNLKGTLNLLEASRRSDVERFVYTSSYAVYGDVQVSPLSPYAASKAAAEVYYTPP